METYNKDSAALSLRRFIHAMPGSSKPVLFSSLPDISSLPQEQFEEIVHRMARLFSQAEWQATDAIAGIEPQGVLLAAGLVIIKQKEFIKIQRQHKEIHGNGSPYNQNALYMPQGAGKLIIVDNILATEGRFRKAAKLVIESGYTLQGFCCLVNLCPRNHLQWNNMMPRSLIEYQESELQSA